MSPLVGVHAVGSRFADRCRVEETRAEPFANLTVKAREIPQLRLVSVAFQAQFVRMSAGLTSRSADSPTANEASIRPFNSGGLDYPPGPPE